MAENLVLRLIAQSDKFRRDIRSSKKSVDTLTGSVNATKSAMRGLAALAGTGLGLHGISRGIRSSITEFAAFEKQMANVSTMLRGQNMKFLPGYTKTLSKMSVEFGESTDTLSKGLYDILSASIPASKALDVLAVSAKAATAGVTTTAVSADAITSILNSYSMSADQASKVSSDLFETVQRGKITFQELSQDIGKVASLAATGGVSLEALLATVSTLTRAGLKSEMAMTGVKNIINSFVTKATPDAVEAARQLGISFDISSLAGDGLITIFQKLKRANMQQLGALMPNVRGLVALSAGIRQAGNAFEDLQYIQNTSGADLEAFGKINDTTAKSIDRMQQSWALLKRTAGEEMAPDIQTLAVAFTELSKKGGGLYKAAELAGKFATAILSIPVGAAFMNPFSDTTALAGETLRMNKLIEGDIPRIKEQIEARELVLDSMLYRYVYKIGDKNWEDLINKEKKKIEGLNVTLDNYMAEVNLTAEKLGMPGVQRPRPRPSVGKSQTMANFEYSGPWKTGWRNEMPPYGPAMPTMSNFGPQLPVGGISADEQKERDKLAETTQGIKDQVEAYKMLEDGKIKHLEVGKFMIEAERVYGDDLKAKKAMIDDYTIAFGKLSAAKEREKKRDDAIERQKKGAEGVAKTFEAMRLEADMIGKVGDAWHRSNQYAQLHADALDEAAGNLDLYNRRMAEAEELHKKIMLAEKWAKVSDAMESSMATAFERMTQDGLKFGEAMKNIAYDIMKAFARAMVIEPMANAGADLFRSFLTNAATGGIMGIGGAGIGGITETGGVGKFDAMIANQPIQMHSGGIGSKYGGIRRSGISSNVFNGAPYLHEGLKKDEFPAILQTGEEVIPRGGSASGGVSVTINNNGTPQRVTDQQTSMENGKMMLSLWVEDFMNEGDTFNAVAGSKGLR